MSVSNFKAAVVNSDVATISKISGLGKKTAERIVLELKDKLEVAAHGKQPVRARATPEQSRRTKQCWPDRARLQASRRTQSRHDLQQKGRSEISRKLVKLVLKKMAREDRQKTPTPNIQPPQRSFRCLHSRWTFQRWTLTFCFIMQVQDQNGRLAAIRAHSQKEGLFAEKEWLLSPDAFPIDRKSLADSSNSGIGCLFFRRACNQLYQLTFKASNRMVARTSTR